MEDKTIHSVTHPKIIFSLRKVANPLPTQNEDTPKGNPQKPEDKSAGGVKDSASTAEVVDKINDFIKAFSTKVAFSIDSETNQPIILVIERESGKVIRRIPPEEMLELNKKMDEIVGIIFNRRI